MRTRIVWLLFHSLTSVALMALFVATAPAQTASVSDVGLDWGFQDVLFGHHKRGRAVVAADFDLDGRTDFYIGNPGEESFVLLNVPAPDGTPRFELAQVLLSGDRAWGAAAADFDNDGDYDLFISIGGNEGVGHDYLFRNLWIENGESLLTFEDVSDAAGIKGPIPFGATNPIGVASAHAEWADVNLDGFVDLFVNVNIMPASPNALKGRNILWLNNGDGTFSDVTFVAGLFTSARRTRHSTFLDIDNDGDPDLYETNYTEPNVLWKNRFVEDSTLGFQSHTAAFSPPGEDIAFPLHAFASTSADFNNDGWQDLIVFRRDPDFEPGNPYFTGHHLYINQNGTGFVNEAAAAALNNPFEDERGVMGCQVGDVNADGVPDVFIGNGFMFGSDSPNGGQFNQLFLSDSSVGSPVHFTNASSLIDFAAPEDLSLTAGYPPYPYRTHGATFTDTDGDGLPELAVSNGGPARHPDYMREPNRLFRFDWTPAPTSFRVRLAGDGHSVSRDAIGTRLALTVSKAGGSQRTIRQTLTGGSSFSAQNGFEVLFGLGDADTIHSLQITWPDGHMQTINSGLAPDGTTVALRTAPPSRVPATVTAQAVSNQISLNWDVSCSGAISDYSVYEGPIGGDFTSTTPETCTTAGATTRSVPMPQGSAFYLVVPRDASTEGSYGRSGDGIERSVSSSACLPRVWNLPGDVSGLVASPSNPTRLDWNGQVGTVGLGLTYDVLGGGLQSLRTTGVAAGTCVAGDVIAPRWDDPRGAPVPGDGFWYLIRATSGCESGSPGSAAGRSALDGLACTGL